MLWSFFLDFGRHKHLQTFTWLLENTRSNLTNPFPQSGLATSLLYWDKVHPGSWSPFLEDKGDRPTDGMLVQNFNSNSSWQHWRSHLGESSFFPKREKTKEHINIGQKNFISQIILPSPHCSPCPWAARSWVLSARHFGQDFHHFLPHKSSQLWQGQGC